MSATKGVGQGKKKETVHTGCVRPDIVAFSRSINKTDTELTF